MLCLCHYGPALLTFWFQTDLGRENSASYLKMQAGKTDTFHFSHHSHTLVTLHVQFLCYDQNLTGEFMGKIYAASCDLFTLTEFCVNLWCFNCLFPLDVQNEIQLLSRVFCYSWLVCLLNFWLRNAQLVKVGWHRFCFSPCWMRKRIIKAQAILALLDSLQELHLEIW